MIKVTNIRTLLITCLCLLWLSACSNRWAAPVEDRNGVNTTVKKQAQTKTYGLKPSTYIVSSGESLYSIGFKYGLDYHQIARWNNISAPYRIYPGQKLQLRSGQLPATATVAKKVDIKPLKKAPVKTAAKVTQQPVKKPTAPVTKKSVKTKTVSSDANRKVNWQWPTNGKVIKTYLANDPGRKGIDIAGRDGQSIRAASSGLVVYSGNGLLGYGELIIIKHSDKYLSAYAYNRKRLVGEGEKVQAGQKIAEMGRGDDGRVKLHFEIRVNGKPHNPQQYLPRR